MSSMAQKTKLIYGPGPYCWSYTDTTERQSSDGRIYGAWGFPHFISCITSPECLLLVRYHLVNSANTAVHKMSHDTNTVNKELWEYEGLGRQLFQGLSFYDPSEVKKLPTTNVKWKFNTLLTRLQNWMLSWAS